VPVMRRATGGCAVVLTPAMAAISFALYTSTQKKSSDYFRAFNAVIIHALATLGVSGAEHKGISDIALGGRKIAGTALYRNREMIFYHAVLNLSGGTELMERYLQAPPRTPDYRAGRRHRDFVTSLAAEGLSVEINALKGRIETEFQTFIEAELTEPSPR
jgi:lipoate---protein ligase